MDFLQNIKAIPITDYAERLGFTLIPKGKYYTLKEHDSVMIDVEQNCFWRNSVFKSGHKGGAGSVIDFAIHFDQCNDAKEAMRRLSNMYGVNTDRMPQVAKKARKEPIKNEGFTRSTNVLALPQKGKNNNAVFHYLHRKRKIDLSIIKYFFARKMIYQDINENCVFVSQNFACMRSTKHGFMGDVKGSDYNNCFFVGCSPVATTLVVAESVIDIMSIMSYFNKREGGYGQYNYLALCSTSKIRSIYKHLGNNKNIKTLLLAFDNDEAGRSAKDTVISDIDRQGFEVKINIFSPPYGKDWNEAIRKIKDQDEKKDKFPLSVAEENNS